MKRQITTFLAIIVAAILFLAGLWLCATRKNERDAKRFFQDAQRFEVGKTTADQVLKLVTMSRRRTNGGFARCLSGAGDCTGTIYFENYSHFVWLYRLHLATPMIFLCRFDIDDYKLQGRSLEMVYAADGNIGTFIRESTSTQRWPGEPFGKPEGRYLRITEDRPGGYLGVKVAVDAPPDLRKLVYNFNFHCLSKLRGCRTFEEMLPVLARKE